MPNPKLGTVSDDLVNTVNKIRNKFAELKNDKDGNLSMSIGRKTLLKKILENLNYVFENLKKDKPNMINSVNFKKIFLASTMGPSFKINFKYI